MQNWFFISLAAPILWTIVNYIDKYLLSTKMKGKGVGAIFLFSSLFSATILPFIYFYDENLVIDLGATDISILIFIGMLNGIAFLLYLTALDLEETSIVIPLLQLIPLFGYVLSYLILGEYLTMNQILASAIILIGVIILSLEFDTERKLKLKKKVLLLIAGSSFLYALNDVLFKAVALRDTFSSSIFWQYAGLTLTGLFVLAVVPRYRKQFFSVFKDNPKSIFLLSSGSEILYIIGNLATNFASLFTPVALVLVVTSYQPLFVFIGGILLTYFLPKIATEKMQTTHLVQKFLSIVIILIGSYLLYSSS